MAGTGLFYGAVPITKAMYSQAMNEKAVMNDWDKRGSVHRLF